MGFFMSKIKDTRDILAELQKEIEQIEHAKWIHRRHQKHIIGFFLFFSILIYIVSSALFYFYSFKKVTNFGKTIFTIYALLAPIAIFYLKNLVNIYYAWKLEKEEERLVDLRKEKRSILDRVMETETYKVAKELLEKYDPSSLKEKSTINNPMTDWRQNDSATLGSRNLAPMTPRHGFGPSGMPNTPQTPRLRHNQTIHNNQGTAQPNTSPLISSPSPMRTSMVVPPSMVPNLQASLTRPIPPQDRSFVEKMVDYVVGDGPNNRYALICRFCYSHNGMALKEEFEFLAYRCCYCGNFNPARKMKPVAPRLVQHFQLTNTRSETVESDAESPICDTVTDEEKEIVSAKDVSNDLLQEDEQKESEQKSQNIDLKTSEEITESKDLLFIDETPKE